MIWPTGAPESENVTSARMAHDRQQVLGVAVGDHLPEELVEVAGEREIDDHVTNPISASRDTMAITSRWSLPKHSVRTGRHVLGQVTGRVETVLAGILHTVADTAPAAVDLLGLTLPDTPTGLPERLVSARTRPHGTVQAARDIEHSGTGDISGGRANGIGARQRDHGNATTPGDLAGGEGTLSVWPPVGGVADTGVAARLGAGVVRSALGDQGRYYGCRAFGSVCSALLPLAMRVVVVAVGVCCRDR